MDAGYLMASAAAVWLCSCATPGAQDGSATPAQPEHTPESSTPATAPAHRALGDAVDAPMISLRWETGASDAWLTQALQASIMNRDEQPAHVEVWLLALGLDQRVAERHLLDLNVPGGTSEQLAVPLDRLPIQSESAPAQTYLVARYDNAGQSLRVPSDPLHVQFRDDYAAAQVVSGEPQVALETTTEAGRARALGALQSLANHAPYGRYYQDGAWHAPGAQGGVIFGHTQTITADAPTLDALRTLAGVPVATAAPDGALVDKAAHGSIVCFKWHALFIDTDLGEGYLKRQELTYGTTSNNAAFATYSLLDATTMTFIASGTLDSLGCTPNTSLQDNHNFTMIAIPDMNSGGRNISVRETPTSPSWRWYTANFTSGTTATIVQTYSGIDELTNAAAVAARLHQLSSLGLPTGAYTIYAKKNCEPMVVNGQTLIIDACYVDGAVYIGYESVNQQPTTLWKYVIGHEIGHMVADKMFGQMPHSHYDYVNDDSFHRLCGCTHIADVNLRAHCLQSAEWYGAAIDEGFGHFFATALFNTQSTTNGTFIYYKAFQDPSQVNPNLPPVAKNAATPVQWWFNRCIRDNAVATEYDWLTFYWNLYAASPQLTLADIADVHKGACGGNPCDGLDTSPAITWSKLTTAATNKWGATHAKTVHFKSAGAAASIDH
jgi:hypothetical protein